MQGVKAAIEETASFYILAAACACFAVCSSQDTREVVTWGKGLNLPEEAIERLVSGKISEPDDLVALLHRSSHQFMQHFCESYRNQPMRPFFKYNMAHSPSLGAFVVRQQLQKRSKSTYWFLRPQSSRLPAHSLTIGYQHWQKQEGQTFFFGHTAERMGQAKRNHTTCHSFHSTKSGERPANGFSCGRVSFDRTYTRRACSRR
jgi:hypothetical protein